MEHADLARITLPKLKLTERERQFDAAVSGAADGILTAFDYVCDDGMLFSAIAHSESGAFQVLNAERPGMQAELAGIRRY